MANVITVTALNRYVKSILESDSVLTDVAIKGEISNFVNHYKTGHFYFSLKDGQCCVKAVMFKQDNRRLSFTPQNGMSVIVRCRISLYERDGSFQIYVEDMFPDGAGAMQLAFEQLKQRLDAEGLFDAKYKKPIPTCPKVIGLVTSKTGAALQDILNVTGRRWPMAHFLLAPVTVQGERAATEIAQAITQLDKICQADVIIVARGGGSAEDLWVFNNEKIARAAFACKTPLISAIGHEIDFTILDFVADLRAPTPSAAAELAVPDFVAVNENYKKICINMRQTLYKKHQMCYNDIIAAKQSSALFTAKKKMQAIQTQLRSISVQLQREVLQKQTQKQQQLAALTALCGSLNPYDVLARGYAVVCKNKIPKTKFTDFKIGENVDVKFDSFTLNCTVNSKEEEGFTNGTT
ncbi:MAG: exodeoxyribonuclease VII large subunit [Oscillospiraceae bacterium]|nr:exodeoxyribonuclease VII large subunit [Oscillospiraceae bacterium]